MIDVNGDGRPDVISSVAHDYGIFWIEHGRGKWVKHLIDDSWSQAARVDARGCARREKNGLLTGKRYMAHNGHDLESASRLESTGTSACSIQRRTRSTGPGT